MSRREKQQPEPRKKSPEKKEDSPPKRRVISQEEVDSSAHRLSRVPDRFGMFRSLEVESQESFCSGFFKSNPGALDMRSPAQKLKELQEKLKKCNKETRFPILMQIKSVQYMMHSEDSVESLRAHVELGKYYNDIHKPPSAIRHFEKAKQLSKAHEIEERETVAITIELAYAYASLKDEKRIQTLKNANTAGALLSPYQDKDIGDPRLKLLLNIANARIAHAKRKYQAALDMFDRVMGNLTKGDDKAELAQVYLERGECYEGLKNIKQAKEEYKKSYELFAKLDAVAVLVYLKAKMEQPERPPPPPAHEKDEEKPTDKM